MVCWTVPLISAIISTIVWKVRRGSQLLWWLTIMLYGGAIFGFVDHLWNGELLLVPPDWVADLALGTAITGGITGAWGFLSVLKTYGILKIGLVRSKER